MCCEGFGRQSWESKVEVVWAFQKKRGRSHIERAVELEVAGKRLVGRPRKTWRQGVEEDLRCFTINEDMVDDRKQWR